MKFAFFFSELDAQGRAVVREVFEAPREQGGITFHLHELYHASLVLNARQCPNEAVEGSTLNIETGDWSHPEPAVAAADADDETGNGEPPRD